MGEPRQPGDPPEPVATFVPVSWGNPSPLAILEVGQPPEQLGNPNSSEPLDLQIFRAGLGRIIDPQRCVVGEEVILLAKPNRAGPPLSDIKWSVSGSFVTSYAMHLNEGKSEASVTSTSTLSFYWIAGGKCKVDISAVFNGKSLTSTVEFEVLAPRSSYLAALTRTVIWGLNPDRDLRKEGEYWFGLFGEKEEEEGIRIACGLKPPSSGIDGWFGFLQLIHMSRTEKDGKGKIVRDIETNGFVLDDPPVAVISDVDPEGVFIVRKLFDPKSKMFLKKSLDFLPGASKGLTTECTDSPASRLSDGHHMIIHDKFKTYLMYRINKRNSIFVTLAMLEWEFKGAAVPVGQNKWKVNDSYPNKRVSLEDKQSNELPKWRSNASAFTNLKK